MLKHEIVFPVKGITCIDPRTNNQIPVTGIRVGLGSYWKRRLAAGECVLKAPERIVEKKKVIREEFSPEPEKVSKKGK